MSTDFIAFFDVTIAEVDPAWLLPRVEARPEVFAPFVERYGHDFRSRVWSVETRRRARAVDELVGPGGFVIGRQGDTLELWHGIRFSMFSGDEWHRGVLRGVCLLIAGLVGSRRAIYTHELMPCAGADGLVNIESQLRARIGPPADTFEALHAADLFGPRAWYIDAFADLGG